MTLTFDDHITLTFSRGSEDRQWPFRTGDILRLASIEEHPGTVLPHYTLRTLDGWTATYVSAVGLFSQITFNP